jgi:hypothetical protein
MLKRITGSLLALLVIVLSACARETPTPPSSVQIHTATPIPSPTTAPIPTGETPEAGPCELVANTPTTVYQRPSLDTDIFSTQSRTPHLRRSSPCTARTMPRCRARREIGCRSISVLAVWGKIRLAG